MAIRERLNQERPVTVSDAIISFVAAWFAKASETLAWTATFLGLKGTVGIWPILGGVTAGFLERGTIPFRILTGAVGAVFAMAFGPVLGRVLAALAPASYGVTIDDILPATGYLCGVCGMALTGAAIESARRVKAHAPGFVDWRMRRD